METQTPMDKLIADAKNEGDTFGVALLKSFKEYMLAGYKLSYLSWFNSINKDTMDKYQEFLMTDYSKL